MPDTCVPTSTSVTGSMVPVAVKLLPMVAFSTLAVSYVTSKGASFRPHMRYAEIAATAMIATVEMIFVFFFMMSVGFDVSGVDGLEFKAFATVKVE